MTEVMKEFIQKNEGEKIIEIEIERLRSFKNHPFQVKDDKEMYLLKESIEKYGILNPLIVRPVPDGVYEIISGHRRKHAAELLGYRKVPVLIRVMTEDESILNMVDSNLHRERISFSEKAFAYKMKNDVLKRKSGRKKGQIDHKTQKKRTVEIISEECGDSPKQVQRYISLTRLIPELTGDAKRVADQVAASLGIDEVYSELLPGDKVSKVEELLAMKSEKDKLAFVGDGINDAPVLTRADIGIAMGAMGSDAAIEAADVVLMDDDPLKISKAIKISRKCLRIVYQNIVFALIIKFACLGLGAIGIANMWFAIFADVGVMIIAILNAIRALRVHKL